MKKYSFYTRLDGRISQKDYLINFGAPFFIFWLILTVISPPSLFRYFSIGYLILSFWPAIATGTKRCHDRGRSGWFQLIFFIPLIGPAWLFFELLFMGGTNGKNRFG